MQYISKYTSPLGAITLASNGEALTGLWFDGQKYFGANLSKEYKNVELPVFKQTKEWLNLYFNGQKPDFIPLLALQASEFRLAVWQILLEIPYGQTLSYGDISAVLFHPLQGGDTVRELPVDGFRAGDTQQLGAALLLQTGPRCDV